MDDDKTRVRPKPRPARPGPPIAGSPAEPAGTWPDPATARPGAAGDPLGNAENANPEAGQPLPPGPLSAQQATPAAAPPGTDSDLARLQATPSPHGGEDADSGLLDMLSSPPSVDGADEKSVIGFQKTAGPGETEDPPGRAGIAIPCATAADDETRIQPRPHRKSGVTAVPGPSPNPRSATVGGFGLYPDSRRAAAGMAPAGAAVDSGWPHRGRDPAGVGEILKGRFRLEAELGAGGMGVVYKARDLVREGVAASEVALKMLGEGFKGHTDSWKSLLLETENTRKLRHPNIIEVYDFDHDIQRDVHFMTMEYLDGRSLEHLLRETPGQPLAPDLAHRIIAGLAAALHHAHAQNPIVVHSDVKPSNVFLTRDGAIKVLDFGIARLKPKSFADDDDFDDGSFGGYSITYASCELMEGWPPDPRDDIYALACIAYRLLSGRHPFGPAGERHGARYARDAGLTPAPIKGLSKGQQRALARGLAFARKDRIKSVAAFLAELQPDAAGRRRKFIAIAAALLLAAGLALLAPWHRQAPEAEDAAQALLAPFAARPASPADWLEPARHVRQQLADPVLGRNARFRERTQALARGFLEDARRQLAAGDREGATQYLALAEIMSIDPSVDTAIGEARTALDASAQPPPPPVNPEPPTAEQQLLDMVPGLRQLPLKLPKTAFRGSKREPIPLQVEVPSSGSLHVFFFQQGEPAVLVYPNAKFSDSRVAPGPKAIERLRALPPYGQVWFIGVASTEAENLYRRYESDTSRIKQGMLVLSTDELLAFLRERAADGRSEMGSAAITVVQ